MSAGINFCPECGKKLPPEVTFCPYCGGNIKQIVGEVVGATTEGQGARVSAEISVVTSSSEEQPIIQNTREYTPLTLQLSRGREFLSKNKKNSIIIALCLLCALSGGYFIASRNGGCNSSATTVTMQKEQFAQVIGEITGNEVKVRANPTMLSKPFAYLYRGDEVLVTGRSRCDDLSAAIVRETPTRVYLNGVTITLCKGQSLTIRREVGSDYECDIWVDTGGGMSRETIYIPQNAVRKIYGNTWYNVTLPAGEKGFIYADYVRLTERTKFSEKTELLKGQIPLDKDNITIGEANYFNGSKYYSVSYGYGRFAYNFPLLVTQADPNLASINRQIMQSVRDKEKGDYRSISSGKCSLRQKFEVKCKNEKYFSVRFWRSYFGDGAAHPLYSCLAMTFELSTGRMLSWQEIVRPEDEAFFTVANLHRYIKDPNQPWIQSRVNLKSEIRRISLQKLPEKYYIDNNGRIHFIFDDGELGASYAAGPLDVDTGKYTK